MENRERQTIPESTWPTSEQGRTSATPGSRPWEPQERDMTQPAAEQAARVTELAAARGRQLVESAREGAQQAAEYVQGAVEQTREKLNEYREGGVERVRDDALRYTREQPMNALLIAAGVGLVIGWLTALGRR
jgi:ElaB/YqjD/DUF883 family membrane-anchored ribosome-binding protein